MLLIQFTGLSGAGKTTIALYLKHWLGRQDLTVEVIDADDYRKTLCKDLGFSKKDRCENIRRLGKAAGQFATADIVIISAINPYEEVRNELREEYYARTVWIKCALNTLVTRDTKGLYRRSMLPDADPQKLFNLTGINDVFETPQHADLIVNTDTEAVRDSAEKIMSFIKKELSIYVS